MKLLLLLQLGFEVVILVLFFVILYRLRRENRNEPVDERLQNYQALLADADKMTKQFDEQLAEKKRLIKELNTKLDEKAMSMAVLLKRAEAIGSNPAVERIGGVKPTNLSRREEDVLRLAAEGHGTRDIAGRLSIPKEEVKLVLKLQNKSNAISV